MSLQVLVLFAVVAVALGSTVPSYNTPAPSYSAPAPSYRAPSPSYNAPAPSGPAQYDFNYAVRDDYSGNDYNHQENRNGYDTQGSLLRSPSRRPCAEGCLHRERRLRIRG
nr:uncharacterized protein LOC113825664 [Penaeus vannamei]